LTNALEVVNGSIV